VTTYEHPSAPPLFTITRNDRDGIYPHSLHGLIYPHTRDARVMQITDEDADALEAALARPALAPSEPRRFTAELRDTFTVYLYEGDDHMAVIECDTDDQAEAVARIFNARPLRDPSLPEGVRVCDDGTLVAPGSVVRRLPDDEWQRRQHSGETWYEEVPNSGAWYEGWYELTRTTQPKTERVPWGVELIGRKVPDHTEHINYLAGRSDHVFGHLLAPVGCTPEIVWFKVADADGTVEVVAWLGLRRDAEA